MALLLSLKESLVSDSTSNESLLFPLSNITISTPFQVIESSEE
jgi:hypothetical protein